jgi:hypothetical protein
MRTATRRLLQLAVAVPHTGDAGGLKVKSARLIGWESTFLDECCPLGDTVRKVDAQDADGCAARGSPTHKDGAVPAKMPFPVLPTRIEKRRDSFGKGVNAGKVCALVAIVKKTGQSQIIATARPGVAFGDDVIKLERNQVLFLRELAVLTAGLCPRPNFANDMTLHALLTRPNRFFYALTPSELSTS